MNKTASKVVKPMVTQSKGTAGANQRSGGKTSPVKGAQMTKIGSNSKSPVKHEFSPPKSFGSSVEEDLEEEIDFIEEDDLADGSRDMLASGSNDAI